MSSSISISRRRGARGYARYFVAAAGTTLLVLVLTAAINWWVDPFNKLGRNWIGVHGVSGRDAKPAMFGDGTAWEGVILGSSKTTYIDPRALICPGFFNASFPGAVPEEMLDFARVHLQRQRFALIGLDFYMINENAAPWRPEGLDIDTSLAARAEYLLGGRVLLASLRDLWHHVRDRPRRLAPAGNRNAQAQLARHAAMDAPDHETTLKMLASRHFADVAYSERRLAVLERLRELLEARGIRYLVFLNPLHRRVLDLLESLPAHDDFLRFRHDLRQIFPDLVDLTESKWSQPENYFRFDPYHYLPAVGSAFVNEMLPRLCVDDGAARQGPRTAGSPWTAPPPAATGSG